MLPGTHIVQGSRFSARIVKDSEIGEYGDLQTQCRKSARNTEIEDNMQQEKTHIVLSTSSEQSITGAIHAVKDYHSVLIQLYGIDGNLCCSLIIENIKKGESCFSMNVSALPNGMYIVVSKLDDGHFVAKVLLNK